MPARSIGPSWRAALVVAVLVVEAAVALLALLDHLVSAEGAAIILQTLTVQSGTSGRGQSFVDISITYRGV